MKKDYKVGDRVEIIVHKYNHNFKIGHIGVITISEDDNVLTYQIDYTCWVSAEEIKPAPIDLNAKEPFFANGDVKVWVWDDDSEYAKELYLYCVDNRCKWPYTAWGNKLTMQQFNRYDLDVIAYKNASLTNPNEPEKTIIIDGKEIKLSEKSFNNLRDFFNGWSENKSG